MVVLKMTSTKYYRWLVARTNPKNNMSQSTNYPKYCWKNSWTHQPDHDVTLPKQRCWVWAPLLTWRLFKVLSQPELTAVRCNKSLFGSQFLCKINPSPMRKLVEIKNLTKKKRSFATIDLIKHWQKSVQQIPRKVDLNLMAAWKSFQVQGFSLGCSTRVGGKGM